MLLAILALAGLGASTSAFEARRVELVPGAIAIERCEHAGQVHLWALGAGDLALRIEGPASAAITEDDDSGGGTTPYVALGVDRGDELRVSVAVEDGSGAPVELWIAAAPEDDRTRAAPAEVERARGELAALQQRGEHEAARDRLRALAAWLDDVDGAGESGAVALARRQLGMVAWSLGDVETCASLWRAAVRHLERTRPPEHLELLKLMGNLGFVLMHLGERTEAAALHERVAAACQRTLPPEHPDVLVALVNLAIARKETGALFDAEVLERRVLEVFERTRAPDDPGLLTLLGNHGVTLRAVGDLRGARVLFERALAGYERTVAPGAPELLRTRSNLAVVLADLDELEAAREQLELLLAEGEDVLPPDHFDLVRARLNLAGLTAWLGDTEGALAQYDAVITVLAEQLRADDPTLLAARLNRASLLGQIGRFEQATAETRAVLDVYERSLPREHVDRLTARGDLLRLLLESGRTDEARVQARPLVAALSERALSVFALAPREAREALASDERWLPWVLYLADGADPELELALVELIETRRLAAGTSGRGLVLIDGDAELARLARRAARARGALQDLALDGSASSAGKAERLERASMERDTAERALRRGLIEHGLAARPIEAAGLIGSLPRGTAALGFLRCRAVAADAHGMLRLGEDRLFAHVLVPGSVPRRVDLGPAAELERLVADWRAAIGTPLTGRGVSMDPAPGDGAGDDGAERRLGTGLRARLVDPLLALAGEVERLEVCADDVVHLVPMDALPDGDALPDDDRRLGDRLHVVLRSSFEPLLRPAPAPSGAPTLMALGSVDYEAGARPEWSRGAHEPDRGSEALSPLPGAARELAALTSLHAEVFSADARVLTGADATRAAVVSALPGARYVHLATHGWFASESSRSLLDAAADDSDGVRRRRASTFEETVVGFAPATLCGLALAGANHALRGERDPTGGLPGVLTAEELAGLDLSSCELAVLSACETNVGIRRAGQGIQSLQSALHAAGARTAITSLWRVDDAATRALMERFYDGLWRQGLSDAEALWRAKRELRDAGHPVRDWAGWVLTGAPD